MRPPSAAKSPNAPGQVLLFSCIRKIDRYLSGALPFRAISVQCPPAEWTAVLQFDAAWIKSSSSLYNARSKESVGMYFIIEYVDTVAGIEGEALTWEFAKTEGEATIKARAHLLLFKARFGAQGYRILSPAGSLIAYGPGAQDEDTDDPVPIEPLPKGDQGETRDRFCTQGLHDSEHPGWRSSGQGSPFVYSKTILERAAKGTAFRTSRFSKRRPCRTLCDPSRRHHKLGRSLSKTPVWPVSVSLLSRTMGLSLSTLSANSDARDAPRLGPPCDWKQP